MPKEAKRPRKLACPHCREKKVLCKLVENSSPPTCEYCLQRGIDCLGPQETAARKQYKEERGIVSRNPHSPSPSTNPSLRQHFASSSRISTPQASPSPSLSPPTALSCPPALLASIAGSTEATVRYIPVSSLGKLPEWVCALVLPGAGGQLSSRSDPSSSNPDLEKGEGSASGSNTRSHQASPTSPAPNQVLCWFYFTLPSEPADFDDGALYEQRQLERLCLSPETRDNSAVDPSSPPSTISSAASPSPHPTPSITSMSTVSSPSPRPTPSVVDVGVATPPSPPTHNCRVSDTDSVSVNYHHHASTLPEPCDPTRYHQHQHQHQHQPLLSSLHPLNNLQQHQHPEHGYSLDSLFTPTPIYPTTNPTSVSLAFPPPIQTHNCSLSPSAMSIATPTALSQLATVQGEASRMDEPIFPSYVGVEYSSHFLDRAFGRVEGFAPMSGFDLPTDYYSTPGWTGGC